ncbi:putative ATPase, V0 complex, subunit e1/e2 [Helianthus annuus]|nr:putative ATPase, V0 complex, subunit e1/e2 [Helianthus annuus]
MGFVVTTLTFIVIGIVACFCTRVCCNKGPSANLFLGMFGKTSWWLVAGSWWLEAGSW